MGRVVPTSTQKASAEKLCKTLSKMKEATGLVNDHHSESVNDHHSDADMFSAANCDPNTSHDPYQGVPTCNSMIRGSSGGI